MEYRYAHFQRAVLAEDMNFRGGPRPGDPLPDFELPTTEGGSVRRSDFVGRRPLLIVFGSITCPMTASSADVLKELYAEFAGRVAFLTVYVREAHPGDRYPQPDSSAEKLEHARTYKLRDQIPWLVAVDDVEGRFHRAMDGKPHAAYLVEAHGRVAFRALWANEAHGLREALHEVLGGPAQPLGERRARMVPMLRGMGVIDEVLSTAGDGARKDVREQAPPLYFLGRLAGIFRPLSPLGRGVAAAVVLSGVLLGVVALIIWGLAALAA
jgi:hypothetical protein